MNVKFYYFQILTKKLQRKKYRKSKDQKSTTSTKNRQKYNNLIYFTEEGWLQIKDHDYEEKVDNCERESVDYE